MTRKAIVAAVGESWIDLLSLDETEKAHDDACGREGCGSTGCGCRVTGRPFRAAPPRAITVKAGDLVEVTASGGRAFGASLAVFGPPIAGAAAGWLLIRTAFPGAPEGAVAAGAAGGLVIMAALTVWLGSRNKHRRLPEITGIVG